MIIQGLAILVFLDVNVDNESDTENALAFRWIYLSPLAPDEPPPEVEPPEPPPPLIQMPRITLITPENFDPYAVPIEDLRIVAVPMLQVIPYNQPGGGSIRLGLGAYFACDVASYDSLTPQQQQDCATRLIALRQQSETLRQNRLLSVLTADELQRWSRWENEYRANHDNAALPCMSTGINLAALDCVVSNITGGYDANNNPQPRTGQVQE